MEDLTNISVIKRLFEESGFSFSKALGQNFLINPTVCPKIAEMGGADSDHGILEIGTGVGVLTNELAKRAKKVVAIEIDTRLRPILSETLKEYDNVKVIFADVMKTDLNKVISENFEGLRVSVCANLPYYITSPVIMLLLEQRLPLDSITVMVQKEAGARLCAPLPSREAGAVTVAVNYYAKPEMLFNVSRGSFMPSPNVDSCVIRLKINNDTPKGVANEEFFFKTVRGAFSQRRKTLANSVSSAMNIDKQTVNNAITSVSLPQTIRPENLTMQQFIAFSKALENIL